MDKIITPAPRRPYGLRRPLAAMFGVTLVSDIGEKLCDRGIRPLIGGKRRARLDVIRNAGVLFVHVPKNAGMSVSQAIYGEQTKHRSMTWYRRVAPDVAAMPSFAVLRCPIDRFLSAYAYARAGGSRDNSIAAPFQPTYSAFRSIDDALDHVEQATDPYHVDHVFRPQSWYITDRKGNLAVNDLLMMEDIHDISRIVPWVEEQDLPHLNRSIGKPRLSGRQIDRLERLYSEDMMLVEQARAETAPMLPLRVASAR